MIQLLFKLRLIINAKDQNWVQDKLKLDIYKNIKISWIILI